MTAGRGLEFHAVGLGAFFEVGRGAGFFRGVEALGWEG